MVRWGGVVLTARMDMYRMLPWSEQVVRAQMARQKRERREDIKKLEHRKKTGRDGDLAVSRMQGEVEAEEDDDGCQS